MPGIELTGLATEQAAELEEISARRGKAVGQLAGEIVARELEKLRRARSTAERSEVARELRSATSDIISSRRGIPPVPAGAKLTDLIAFLDDAGNLGDLDHAEWARLIRTGRLEDVLPDNLWERLEQRAEAEGSSPEELTVRLLEAALEAR